MHCQEGSIPADILGSSKDVPAIDSGTGSPGMYAAVSFFLLKYLWKPGMDGICWCLGESLFLPKGARNEPTECPPHCCHLE